MTNGYNFSWRVAENIRVTVVNVNNNYKFLYISENDILLELEHMFKRL